MNIHYFPNTNFPNHDPNDVLIEKFVCKVSFTQAQKLTVFDANNVRDEKNSLQFLYLVPDSVIEKSLNNRGTQLKRFTFEADIELLIAEPTLLEKLWYRLKNKLRAIDLLRDR